MGGVSVCPSVLNHILGVLDIGKAGKLDSDAQASLPTCSVNAAAPLLGAIDGLGPVVFVEEARELPFVACQWVGFVQVKMRSFLGPLSWGNGEHLLLTDMPLCKRDYGYPTDIAKRRRQVA